MRYCWHCKRSGVPLHKKFVESDIPGFAGDWKNHLLCIACYKAYVVAWWAHYEVTKPRYSEVPTSALIAGDVFIYIMAWHRIVEIFPAFGDKLMVRHCRMGEGSLAINSHDAHDGKEELAILRLNDRWTIKERKHVE